MSYILDALKKSDKERQRRSIPELLTDHEAGPVKEKKVPAWLYLLLAALLLNLGVLFWWARPWEQKVEVKSEPGVPLGQVAAPATEEGQEWKKVSQAKPSTTVQKDRPVVGTTKGMQQVQTAPASRQAAVNGKAGPPLPKTGAKTAAVEPAAASVKEAPPASDLTSKDAGPESVEDAVTVAGPQPVTKQPATKTAAAGADVPASQRKIVASRAKPAPPVRERIPGAKAMQAKARTKQETQQEIPELIWMPLSFQKSLPEISISVHLYSHNPASRKVSINGRMLREGNEVTNGLMLEEIVESGVVLSFKGKKFRMGVF